MIDTLRINADGDAILPCLSVDVRQKYSLKGYAIIVKRGIFIKNEQRHPDVTLENYVDILNAALYSPEIVVPAHAYKPYLNFIARIDEKKSAVVLLDIGGHFDAVEYKHTYEVVNMHYLHNRQRKQKENFGKQKSKD